MLYGRQFARYWDLVGGIRQDFRPGPAQTWAAFGVQGLAPYWFDVEATGYIGASGRTHARFEVEYELLFTNRLVLQPLFEAELVGKSDPGRGVGAGLSHHRPWIPSALRDQARVCAVRRYHLEQQMGQDRRLRCGRRRRHGRSSKSLLGCGCGSKPSRSISQVPTVQFVNEFWTMPLAKELDGPEERLVRACRRHRFARSVGWSVRVLPSLGTSSRQERS